MWRSEWLAALVVLAATVPGLRAARAQEVPPPLEAPAAASPDRAAAPVELPVAERFWLGAQIGVLLTGSGNAVSGRAREYIGGMGGSVSWPASVSLGPVPTLTQGVWLGYCLGLELRERFWILGTVGEFARNPDLDSSIKRFVVPIDLALVATLDGDAVSVSAGIGPGLYVVATRDEGYFGTGSTTRVAAGVLALIRFSIPVHERVRLVGDLVYDGFKMPGVNPIYGDGGWFDGFTLSVGVVARL